MNPDERDRVVDVRHHRLLNQHVYIPFETSARLLVVEGVWSDDSDPVEGIDNAFEAVATAPPDMKTQMLTASISIAMNTTAFGLIVAIPLLLVHAVMQTKTADLVDNLEMVTVRLSNLMVGTDRLGTHA